MSDIILYSGDILAGTNELCAGDLTCGHSSL